ncbi:M48 family metallopeptidase [Urechidicola croceus]|uniref:Peptidase M48 n=1 Tax=Urechidicola croceus TaxID=1850246 RepID=A0A1D8P5Z6_9FLAO|nr:M48 family metallopeptidase [Urechidicola croceus]AOW20008.1 peptidase M48 [Urechidicola croceus]
MKKVTSLLVVFLFLLSCSTVPITGRKRINLVSDAQILPASFAQYEGFLKENKLSSDIKNTRSIQDVGMKISRAVDRFMRANNMISEANNYRWEFNLIEDENVNAWCMPGGKVVFYTGILPICANTDGVAAVMGHEVAHAFAKHGQERMSQGYLQQAGGLAVAIGTANKNPQAREIWNTAFGLGSQLGMLAFSRTHETEADRLGLVFMIMAGYKPEEAVNVWIRMSQRASASEAPPEFLSTHPSNQTRIKNLKDYMPTAIAYAKKFNEQAAIQQEQQQQLKNQARQ